ncbi:acyltransferase family protein [Mycolicibacterium llatzerense]|uniref:acyltransferase family protein n=1 Tax=Mycolicibacterium llatzerense TaxID=280871 RepID=UPI000697D01E|nr:acyltransferase family protein [Mycolicibacterium llatzerense]
MELPAVGNQLKQHKRLDIQGMRAIAVALVVLFHAEIPGFGGGYVGVDVFFVISGFLISTHLFSELRDRGRIAYGAFYARRVRRLLPAALTVIVATVAAAACWVSPLQFGYVVKDAIAATFYVPNVVFAYRATDYLADKTPSLFMHYWSLGVEEQFYLLWPVLLVGLFGLFKLRSRRVAAICAIVAASFVLCVWLTGFSQPNAFFILFARIWEFGVGGLVAVVLLSRGRVFGDRSGAVAGWAGLAAVVGSGVLFSTATEYPGDAVAVPVIGTALLIAAGPVRWGPAALLSLRPLTWIGDISYSLYLVHWPLLVLPVAATGYMQASPMWLRVAIVVACVPLAWLLYTYVEQPGQRLRWLNASRPRRTLAATAGVMAAVCAVVLAVAVVQDPLLNARRTAAHLTLSLKPAGTAYVPSNLTPQLSESAGGEPVIYANGCHRGQWATNPAGCTVGSNPEAPLVVLFGDSHAAHWYPALSALADQGLIRLDNRTKSHCPSAHIHIASYPRCAEWRENVLASLVAAKPALILLGAWGSSYMLHDADPTAHWQKALTDTVSELPSQSRVAVLADTPSIGVAPQFCLGLFPDNAQRCALPRTKALDARVRQAEHDLATRGAFSYLDYSDYLCNDTVCPSILGDTLVYRDGHHLTVHMSAALAPVIGADVMALLAPSSGPPQQNRGLQPHRG